MVVVRDVAAGTFTAGIPARHVKNNKRISKIMGAILMDRSLDLITVVIPVYNVEPYLQECIDSVLAQSYRNLEIILVDDGSTDGSGKLCDILKVKDVRISVIHKKNAGLGLARNSALEVFAGKYVTFLDSDDYITPSMIETLYKVVKENNVDECKMGFQRVKNDHSVCGETKYANEVFQGAEAKTKYAPRLIGSAPDKHDSIEMCVCGAIFNGDIIRKYNMRFPSERELISEDLIFHLEYLQHANGACTVENTDYKYRVNDSSLSRSYRPDRAAKSLYFYDEVVKRLKEYGYGEDTLNRAKRMLFIYMRMSIAQEVVYENNNFAQALKNIKRMCNNQHLQNVISSYPVTKLGISQRIFLKCIQYKIALLLFVAKKVGAF